MGEACKWFETFHLENWTGRFTWHYAKWLEGCKRLSSSNLCKSSNTYVVVPRGSGCPILPALPPEQFTLKVVFPVH
ncbi:hypothetical protein F8388_025484 [Cannabis sativa]|uniref:Uncharacterized protein n=1 Tax=Cannabis sativa TaxID=3483 RepID=A0A7J6G0T6_CANSA|nr:hypothetical protein F8388_025484 [Cannabis sativa]KAF4390666.1 hypothetical protein G4B88_015556 [Cannabis sativa]